MTETILIVEDEPSIVDNITFVLESESFNVLTSSTIGEARKILKSGDVSLMVLDIGLPDESGLEFCKELRKESTLPVIFLTSRASEIDRVVGLEIGADDYVTKPFSPRELAARVKAVLRRFSPEPENPAASASGSEKLLDINRERKEISFCGSPLRLSRYEYKILELLIDHPARVYSRRQLMEMVWEEPGFSTERTVDTHIKTIRAKLGRINPEKEVVVTHRGFGYALAENL